METSFLNYVLLEIFLGWEHNKEFLSWFWEQFMWGITWPGGVARIGFISFNIKDVLFVGPYICQTSAATAESEESRKWLDATVYYYKCLFKMFFVFQSEKQNLSQDNWHQLPAIVMMVQEVVSSDLRSGPLATVVRCADSWSDRVI